MSEDISKSMLYALLKPDKVRPDATSLETDDILLYNPVGKQLEYQLLCEHHQAKIDIPLWEAIYLSQHPEGNDDRLREEVRATTGYQELVKRRDMIRDVLILRNMKLVAKIAKRYAPSVGVNKSEFKELITEW